MARRVVDSRRADARGLQRIAFRERRDLGELPANRHGVVVELEQLVPRPGREDVRGADEAAGELGMRHRLDDPAVDDEVLRIQGVKQNYDVDVAAVTRLAPSPTAL